MRKRWFLNVNGFEEYVWPLSEFIRHISEGETDEFILEEEKRDIGGPMWCQESSDFVEPGYCGKMWCEEYSPCNGKSGRCKRLKNGFVGTGRLFRLTRDGLTEVS